MAGEWTDDDVAALRRGVEAGETSGQVAKTLMRTRNAVQGKAVRLGLRFLSVALRDQSKADMCSDPRLQAPRVKPLARRKVASITSKVSGATAAAPPIPLPPTRSIPLQCDPVPLKDLRERHCRWVVGEIDGPETLFCGAEKAQGAFCAAHGRLAYQPPSKASGDRPERRERRAA